MYLHPTRASASLFHDGRVFAYVAADYLHCWPVVPRRIVANVFFQQLFNERKLLVPQAELLQDELSVRPSVGKSHSRIQLRSTAF